MNIDKICFCRPSLTLSTFVKCISLKIKYILRRMPSNPQFHGWFSFVNWDIWACDRSEKENSETHLFFLFIYKTLVLYGPWLNPVTNLRFPRTFLILKPYSHNLTLYFCSKCVWQNFATILTIGFMSNSKYRQVDIDKI